MSKDSLLNNPYLIPVENPSAFKAFIFRQDEVGYYSPYLLSDKSSYDLPFSQRIFQRQIEKDKMVCVSIFKKQGVSTSDFSAISRKTGQPDWIFFIFTLCFLITTILIFKSTKRINQLFKAFLTPRSTNQLLREGNIIREFWIYPLLLLFFITITFLVAYILHSFLYIPYNLLLFSNIIMAVSVFFIGKLILISIIGKLFQTKKETLEYLTVYLIFDIILGLFLLPVLFFGYYMNKDVAVVFVSVIVFILLLAFLFRLYRGFLIGINSNTYNLYYLFLYLCTVEILPFGMTFKMMSNIVLTGNLLRF